MIDNYAIADQFSLLAKIMDIHGENPFKSKSYSIAAYTIEQLTTPLSQMPREKIFVIKGIGESTGKKVIEILETGKLSVLEEMIAKTPPGVLEMLNIKGLGPKKIATIWKEMEIESLGELLYACQENRLLLFKGFGAKTQQSVIDAIEFYLKNQDHFLYAEVSAYALEVSGKLQKLFPANQTELTGAYRRQLPVIEKLEWVTTIPLPILHDFFSSHGYAVENEPGTTIQARGAEHVLLEFHLCDREQFSKRLFETSCSASFLEEFLKTLPELTAVPDETELFSAAGLHFIPACMRETTEILDRAKRTALPDLITEKDIKAIIHCHSNWSDGGHSIEEMAQACIEKGYEYMVISDHSKSAFYAKGLTEERIREQHALIHELNGKLKPFRIFKSIECDILSDGTLDYSDPVLSTFDLVITSIHSNLKMTEEKAMSRLIKAIENPYTTILGHPTGRLLLSRKGYPVDHKTIIDACVKHQVVIEINAHPRRLDLDWNWIGYALEKGALLSIDPDAHTLEGYDDVRYGILASQKGGLTADKNLSSFSLSQFEEYLSKTRQNKGIQALAY